MLKVAEKAQEQLRALTDTELADARLRVFIDHRCHCGKAHFSLALEDEPAPEDTFLEVGGVRFVADSETTPELPSVEIDFVESVYQRFHHPQRRPPVRGPHDGVRRGKVIRDSAEGGEKCARESR